MLNDSRERIHCGRRWWGESPAHVAQSELLGRLPQYPPDRPFDSIHIRLDLVVDMRRRSLVGACETRVRPRQAGLRQLVFDAVDLKIAKVFIDGVRARFRHANGRLLITCPKALSERVESKIVVHYRADDPAAGVQFLRSPLQLWSKSQPDDARRWFPCQDAPHSKVTSEIRVRVPAGMKALSNGILHERVARGRSEIWHWKMERPHSVYLISLVVGHFSEVEEEWDGIPIVFYCAPGREEDARRGFAKTGKALRFFSEKTGVRYPYARYAQVAVANYAGGMEHTTCTTQTDACLIDSRAAVDHDLDLLVVHELAHQWFGNLVTCAEWPHAWLNEGFATYFEILFQEFDKGRDAAHFELLLNERAYFDEESRRYRRPIVCRTYAEAWTLFDRHLYEKSSWVLHMLRHQLGEGSWWKSVSQYLRSHEDGSVRTEDLLSSIERATGRNLHSFFDQWVYRPGHPVLRARWSFDKKTRRGSFWLMQTQNQSADCPPFRFEMHLRVSGRGWRRDIRESVSEREHRFSWTFPSGPLNVEFDPEYVLLKRISLAKPAPMWIHQLRNGETAISRSIAAEFIGRWGGPQAVTALSDQIRREKFWGASVEMVHALGRTTGPAVDRELLRLLRDVRHPKVLRAVVSELARRAPGVAEGPLVKFARFHPALGVQAEATRALGRFDGRRHRDLLAKALASRTYRDLLASAAVSAVAAARDIRFLGLLKTLTVPKRPFGVRAAAVRALGEFAIFEPELVPWLCRRVEDEDSRVTSAIIAALGSAEDERAVPTLERLVRTAGNPRIRVHATEAVARIRAGGKKRPARTVVKSDSFSPIFRLKSVRGRFL